MLSTTWAKHRYCGWHPKVGTSIDRVYAVISSKLTFPTGNDSIMRLLLKHGADVSYSDPDHRTALHWSTKLDSVKCLKLLAACAGSHVVNTQVR